MRFVSTKLVKVLPKPCLCMYSVFGKEFYKLGTSVAALSRTFSLDTRKGWSWCFCCLT